MGRMQMAPSTVLVCEQGLDAEALCIQATGCLCSGHLPAHIQRLLLPLGPPTPHPHGTIRLACTVALLSRDQPARLETRAAGIQAAGLARPRRHGARGCVTRGGPARLLQGVLEPRPSACPSAQHHPPRSRWEQPADAFDSGDRASCRTGPLRGLAHPPGQRQGATFLDIILTTWSSSAVHPRPPRLPSMLSPSVGKARGRSHTSA